MEDVTKKKTRQKKTDTWLKYRGTIECCLRNGMGQLELWNVLNEQYEYVACFSAFHKFLARHGFVDSEYSKKKREALEKKCKYPNCFDCLFDDCIRGSDELYNNQPTSESLYKISHGKGV